MSILKSIVTIVLGLFFCQPSYAIAKDRVLVEIYASESASYLSYLASGFKSSRTSRSLDQEVAKQKVPGFQKSANKDAYSRMHAYLEDGYNYAAPATRKMGFYGADALWALAGAYPDLGDFERGLSAILPYSGLTDYMALKKALYPAFKRHFWRPAQAGLAGEIAGAKAALTQTDFSSRILKVRQFYNSSYSLDIPLKIALVPIAQSRDSQGKFPANLHTNARNFKNIQIVPYITRFGVRDAFEVIFHEFCHALFEGQSLKVQKQIEDFYLNQNDPHALFAYNHLDESLATALGNGWYRKALFGKLSTGSWYGKKTIDTLAKSVYPLVARYLAAGRSIDEPFLEATVKLSKKSFPERPFQLGYVMQKLSFHSDHHLISDNVMIGKLRKQFDIRYIRPAGLSSQDDWQRITGNSLISAFVLTAKKMAVYEKLKHYLDQKTAKTITSSSAFLAIIPVRGRYVLWLNATNVQDVDRALNWLQATKTLPNRSILKQW